MMTFRIWAATIVLLCGGSSALSQVAKDPTKPSPRLVAYEQFFTRIAEIRKPSVQPLLTARAAGDKTVVLQPPDLSRILGLSNTEVAKLSQVASDCDRDIRLLYGDA